MSAPTPATPLRPRRSSARATTTTATSPSSSSGCASTSPGAPTCGCRSSAPCPACSPSCMPQRRPPRVGRVRTSASSTDAPCSAPAGRPSCSTGAASTTSTPTRTTPTTSTARRCGPSTRGHVGPPGPSASGTRPSPCLRAATRASTSRCRRPGWARPSGSPPTSDGVGTPAGPRQCRTGRLTGRLTDRRQRGRRGPCALSTLHPVNRPADRGGQPRQLLGLSRARAGRAARPAENCSRKRPWS